MAAVPGSENSVVVDVNPDVVQRNSDNQLGDVGNQTNSVPVEIEEDSNNQLGDASGNQPSSETQDVNPIETDEDAGNKLTSIDKTLYCKATKGDFRAFEQIDDSLTQLVTRVDKNTILHICITAATPYYRRKTARTESVDFVNKALAKCKELLWQRNEKDETILHIAARYGHHDIVEVLLTKDKEPPHNGQAVSRPKRLLEMKNEVGDTALHEAVRYSHLQVVKLLISEDCNYQYGQNNDGETPLYIAAEMGAHDDYFVVRGASPIVRGARDIVQEVLKCESPAYDGPHGRTALHAAVLCNDYVIVNKLCEKFKKRITRKPDNSGWTPLHFAAQEGFASIVELLLEKDKNAAYVADNEEEKTALHVAASKGKAKVVKKFMSACPDCFEQVDKNGQNALHFAAKANRNGHDHTLKLILDTECFSNLINAKDGCGNTPLHLLANSHFPLALDLLYHPKLNARVFNKKNLSPLEVIRPPAPAYSFATIVTSIALKRVGNTPSRQIKDEDEGKEGGGIEDQDGIKKDGLDQETRDVRNKARNRRERVYKYQKDVNLLITILIATVTFAAGFTIPGGYTSDNSSNQAGYPVLMRKPAFIVFAFSNAIAFVLSSAGVFLHLFWHLYSGLTVVASTVSIWCGMLALIAMVVAYVSGTCAVLTPNPSLVAVICVLSAPLFVCICFSEILVYLFNFYSMGWKSVARRRLLLKKFQEARKIGNGPV